MENCSTCDYFRRHEPVPVENPENHQIEFNPNPQGICMVHPPQIFFVPNGSVTAYPQVKEIFGCGEHKPASDGLAQLS